MKYFLKKNDDKFYVELMEACEQSGLEMEKYSRIKDKLKARHRKGSDLLRGLRVNNKCISPPKGLEEEKSSVIVVKKSSRKPKRRNSSRDFDFEDKERGSLLETVFKTGVGLVVLSGATYAAFRYYCKR